MKIKFVFFLKVFTKGEDTGCDTFESDKKFDIKQLFKIEKKNFFEFFIVQTTSHLSLKQKKADCGVTDVKF